MIKLLLASISRQRREVDESAGQERRQKNEDNAIRALITSLRKRLRDDLSPSISDYYGDDALTNELLVCYDLRKCNMRKKTHK